MPKLHTETTIWSPGISSDWRLIEKLASQVLGWKTAPGRFIKPNRSRLPYWKFAPLANLDQAFLLLNGAAAVYVLSADAQGVFHAEVRVGPQTGSASGAQKARVIAVALARALHIEVAQTQTTVGRETGQEDAR